MVLGGLEAVDPLLGGGEATRLPVASTADATVRAAARRVLAALLYGDSKRQRGSASAADSGHPPCDARVADCPPLLTWNQALLVDDLFTEVDAPVADIGSVSRDQTHHLTPR